jgi:hypothetical protein
VRVGESTLRYGREDKEAAGTHIFRCLGWRIGGKQRYASRSIIGGSHRRCRDHIQSLGDKGIDGVSDQEPTDDQTEE